MRLKIHLFRKNRWIACISSFLDVVSFLFFYKKRKKERMEWHINKHNFRSFFSFLIKTIERLSVKLFWWEYNLFRKLVQKQIAKIPSRLRNLSQNENKTGILKNYYSYFVFSNLLSAILPQIEYFDKILEKSNCHFPTN